MVYLEQVQPRRTDAQGLQPFEPGMHERQLVGGGVPAVQGDDEGRRGALAAEPLDDGLDAGRRLAGPVKAAGPPGVVQAGGAVERQSDLDPVAPE